MSVNPSNSFTALSVDPAAYSEETMRVVRTAMALTGDGQGVDMEELADALVKDYNMTPDDAELAIEYAEYIGAFVPAPSPGTMLS